MFLSGFLICFNTPEEIFAVELFYPENITFVHFEIHEIFFDGRVILLKIDYFIYYRISPIKLRVITFRKRIGRLETLIQYLNKLLDVIFVLP